MSTKIKVINFTGFVNVASFAAWQQEIESALKSHSSVRISLSQVEDIDLAGVQLLYAARRRAFALKKEIQIVGDVQESVALRLHQCGFTRTVEHDGRSLNEALVEFARSDHA
jgi:anti-anti-sigma regulatory factor